MLYRISICILFIGCLPLIGLGQSEDLPEPNTSIQVNLIKRDTARNTFGEIFKGEPGQAALYSLALPGGGQIYNKKWIKLPITYAIEGGAAYWLYYNIERFNYYDNIFRELLAGDMTNPDGFTSAAQVNPIRKSFRKQKEYAYVFMLLAHLYNVFDAYVDRHLMEFDISEDLSIQQFPATTPYEVASVGFAWKF